MSAPKTGVYEIIIASPTDAYTSNNAIIDEGLSLIATQTSHPCVLLFSYISSCRSHIVDVGFSILSGSQVDAPAESPKLYVFIGWDSIEHHLSARNSSEYETLKPALGKVFASTSTPDVVHVVFSPDALPVLRAPVTEIAWCTAKAGANDKEAGDKILQAAQRAAELIASRNIATAYGQVVERPGEVVLIVGWDSLEVRDGRI